MQIGEVDFRSRGTVERRHVRLELDQVSRHEPSRQPELPEKLDQEPSRVATRAAAQFQRLLAGLNSRLEADDVADLLVEPTVDLDDVIDGPDVAAAQLT